MNPNDIEALVQATVNGSMPFPEIIGQLIAQDVESYFVDYAQRNFTFYSDAALALRLPFNLPGWQPIAKDWDAGALKAAIIDSQQHGQKFDTFCKRAMHAGVLGYFVFISGKRVLYLGRQGEQHVEWFPGAQPANV